MALADENPNGKITWSEFIPHGINAIQSFLERNKLAAKQKEEQRVQMKPELLKVLYEKEIDACAKFMMKRFRAFDTDPDTKKHSGLIGFKEMETCFHSTSHLTPKEINSMLREYAMSQGMDQINYTNFTADLYRTRFDLMDSRIMEMNLEIMDKIVLDACAAQSADGKLVTLPQLRKALQCCKQLTITPFQVSLLMGFSKPDSNAMVDFAAFAPICAEKIRSMFKIEAVRRKAQLCAVGQFRTSDVKMPAKYNAGSVFAVFRDKDVDRNGFLEWLEYQQCLEALGELADLNKEEGLALNMIADIDGDGRIDYQEFMKHFEEVVYMIKLHNELQEHYDGLPERMQEKMAQQQQ